MVKDKVVTGIAGSEYGIRGFIDAYDAKQANLLGVPMRFQARRPSNDTWSDDSWKTGGAATTWLTGSYDADLNLIYWGTGNPGPDWNGDVRLGDNLYSDSVLALNGDTGAIDWHFQFTPHDVHDYDSIQIPILADIEIDGRTRNAMLWANRNGFYYTLDRRTGEFIKGKAYATQTWAQGLDAAGRPIEVRAWPRPTKARWSHHPSSVRRIGIHPAFSQQTGLFYVTAFDGEQEFFKRDQDYEEGRKFYRRRWPLSKTDGRIP